MTLNQALAAMKADAENWKARAARDWNKGVAAKPKTQPSRGGRKGKPCRYKGQKYPSLTAAALAHGVSVAAVNNAIRREERA